MTNWQDPAFRAEQRRSILRPASVNWDNYLSAIDEIERLRGLIKTAPQRCGKKSLG